MNKKEEILKKICEIRECLNSQFFERKDVIEIILLAILSKQHTILIGEPGLAKTAVLKAFTSHISGLKLFDFQMTPSTDISELLSKNNNNNIGIDNCDIAFIDEFFKGRASALNSLLAIMNERLIYSPLPQKIPLLSLFATSNEKPDKTSNMNLLPLYDRFLLRKEILAIDDKNNFKRLLCIDGDYINRNIFLNIKDIMFLMQYTADNIVIGEEIYDILYLIREELRNKQVVVSDRRWRETVKILKASAGLNGKDIVGQENIKCIESSLWTYYSDIRAVKNILKRALSGVL